MCVLGYRFFLFRRFFYWIFEMFRHCVIFYTFVYKSWENLYWTFNKLYHYLYAGSLVITAFSVYVTGFTELTLYLEKVNSHNDTRWSFQQRRCDIWLAEYEILFSNRHEIIFITWLYHFIVYNSICWNILNKICRKL